MFMSANLKLQEPVSINNEIVLRSSVKKLVLNFQAERGQMRMKLQSLLAWVYLLALVVLLLSSVIAQTPAPTSASTTPSPGTLSPSSPSPSTSSPLSTPSPERSSSSSNSRGETVAWALFTVSISVALLILLYNRERSGRRRVHPGEPMRQNLTAADVLQPDFNPSPDERDPAMSSF